MRRYHRHFRWQRSPIKSPKRSASGAGEPRFASELVHGPLAGRLRVHQPDHPADVRIAQAGQPAPLLLTVPRAAAFASWKAWAEAAGEYVGNERRLVEYLTRAGVDEFRTGKNRVRSWLGIGLREGA